MHKGTVFVMCLQFLLFFLEILKFSISSKFFSSSFFNLPSLYMLLDSKHTYNTYNLKNKENLKHTIARWF